MRTFLTFFLFINMSLSHNAYYLDYRKTFEVPSWFRYMKFILISYNVSTKQPIVTIGYEKPMLDVPRIGDDLTPDLYWRFSCRVTWISDLVTFQNVQCNDFLKAIQHTYIDIILCKTTLFLIHQISRKTKNLNKQTQKHFFSRKNKESSADNWLYFHNFVSANIV